MVAPEKTQVAVGDLARDVTAKRTGLPGISAEMNGSPELFPEQFDSTGQVKVITVFRGRTLEICYNNPHQSDYGAYLVRQILLDGGPVELYSRSNRILIGKDRIDTLDYRTHQLTVNLG